MGTVHGKQKMLGFAHVWDVIAGNDQMKSASTPCILNKIYSNSSTTSETGCLRFELDLRHESSGGDMCSFLNSTWLPWNRAAQQSCHMCDCQNSLLNSITNMA